MVFDMVRTFIEFGKPIAAICHGTQKLISANELRGCMATCYKSIAVEMKRAGADYVDEKVVLHDNLITLCKPANILVFYMRHQTVDKRTKIAIPYI